MSAKKKKPTVTDKINQYFEEDLEDKKDSSEDEAKIAEFDEDESNNISRNRMSDIRKKNVKHLSEIDKKYSTKVSSRKSLMDADDTEESDENDDESSDADEDDMEQNLSGVDDGEDDDDEEGESDENDEDDSSEDDDSDDDEDDDYDDDDHFGDFLNEPVNSTTVISDSSNNLSSSQKGNCVKNQLQIWENLLESRIKLQPLIISSNSLPFPTNFEQLKSVDSNFSAAVENSVDQVSSLLDSLLELQRKLVSNYPESKAINIRKRKINEKSKNSKKSKLDEFSSILEENYNNYKSYRNDIIRKWDDRTRAVANIKTGNNLDIIRKIENALINKEDMVQQSQTYIGDYRICGEPEKKKAEGEEIHYPEIHDDSGFYHNLLRELIEYKSQASDSQADVTKKFIQLQKIRSSMKKRKDTKASKGRKIRYDVHNKLMNFVAPVPSVEWTEETKTKLYNSLFDAVTLNGDNI